MRPVKPDVHFPTLEKNISALWKEKGIIKKGLEMNRGKTPFIFYDGPPFATGLPHYGHILAGTLKDIVPRYWAMKGRFVQRRWGWDCHGLPVEYEMERELGLNGRSDVEKMGVAKFNEACRGIVLRYTKEWEQVITRTGRWVDFQGGYRTMDTPYMETVWWVVKQLFERGLVYEGYRVMPYSWRIATPLSNFEAGLNYKEVQDPSLYVRFKSPDVGGYLLAWTTTPWTLPSNMALAVHPDELYVWIKEKKFGDVYVLGKSLLPKVFSDAEQYEIQKTRAGRDLKGIRYEPLFPYFADLASQGAFQVLPADYVTVTDGTGVVHTAPAFGEDDFKLCQANGIPLVDPVDAEGKFTALVPDYKGMQVKEADKTIIKDLKAQGSVVRHDTLVHNYPFCWRSDTPLIYKAISTWFVKIDPIKQNLLANNQKTHWVPENLRDGRFGNWLENARDWNISRNRFWGTPIPIWRAEDGEMYCVGSIAELEKLSGKKLTDLHKHFVDEVTFNSPTTGKPMKRISEVLDCWFESGSMPYGQAHYPFENQKQFEENFPADFIAEGLDQTRGWFYTLSVLSTALFNKPPFKHVIVNGLILAEDGKKMSKRLKNYPDVNYILDTYGADSLRAYLMNSPSSHAEELRFSENGVKEVLRSVMLPFWNAYSFFVTYANADGWSPNQFTPKTIDGVKHDLDKWVLSRLQSLIQSVDEKMANYHLYEVVPEVLKFIDELTNWYIRLNRRRFWSEEKSQDKSDAYATLYFVLTEFNKILAPMLPFVTEEIHSNLTEGTKAPESVHLSAFPEMHKKHLLPDLEQNMGLIQNVVSMGRTCRSVFKLKNRQPLKEVRVITGNPDDQAVIQRYQELISQELNVKNVSFSADEKKWVTLAAKPNAKVLGPRLGPKMKAFNQKIRELSSDKIAELEKKGKITLEDEVFTKDDILIERQAKEAGAIQTSGGVTIWLDTQLNPELEAEGLVREFVNRVQKLRKDLGFEVTDRIHLTYSGKDDLKSAVEKHAPYITAQTLAEKISFTQKATWSSEQDIDGDPLKLALAKI